MKKILLIGDSIRIGYDRYVQQSMQNVAEVYFPKENSMFTTNILRNLHFWIQNLNIHDADAVHWNAGLWDTVRIYGDKPLIDINTYAENVERINKRIAFLFPNAKIIFATSTPCIESGFIPEFETRFNSDVEAYNTAASAVCEKCGVIVNDLYHLLKNAPEDYHSDQTHFYTADGTELIGGQVNACICDAIGLDKKQLVLPNKYDFVGQKGLSDKEFYVKRGDYYEQVLGV